MHVSVRRWSSLALVVALAGCSGFHEASDVGDASAAATAAAAEPTADGGHSWVYFPDVPMYRCLNDVHDFVGTGGRWVETDGLDTTEPSGPGHRIDYTGPRPDRLDR